MRKIAWSMLLSFALSSGCAFGPSALKDEDFYTTLKPGITTQEEVKQKLGKPALARISSTGGEEWVYQYTPPVPGPMMPAASRFLTIRFDQHGRRIDYDRSKAIR